MQGLSVKRGERAHSRHDANQIPKSANLEDGAGGRLLVFDQFQHRVANAEADLAQKLPSGICLARWPCHLATLQWLRIDVAAQQLVRRTGITRPAAPRFGRLPNRFAALFRVPARSGRRERRAPFARIDQERDQLRTSILASFPNGSRASCRGCAKTRPAPKPGRVMGRSRRGEDPFAFGVGETGMDFAPHAEN